MAKAQGIIGNFKGKIGNTVGYQLTSSNNKQTQGIRIYQPNVKNPKTSAQAEQRAKLAPINATYRALKMVIDRGNESLPYGNKSRLAWLKQAFKATNMPWFVKGAVVNFPVGCQLTKGSLSSLNTYIEGPEVFITCRGTTGEDPTSTIGEVSAAILKGNSFIQEGDQITIVGLLIGGATLLPQVFSFIIKREDNTPATGFSSGDGHISYEMGDSLQAFAVIVSREGSNGEHLRSNEMLAIDANIVSEAPYDAASKTAAIESYMASGAANTDWAEEAID